MLSMTPRGADRPRPDQRLAADADRAGAAGRTVQEVNQLLAQFKQMQKFMKVAGKPGAEASVRARVSRLTHVTQEERPWQLAFVCVAIGRKKLPLYRIVVAEKTAPRDGRFIDVIGTYSPKAKLDKDQITVDAEKARAWLAKGATASETVSSLLRKSGLFKQPTA